MHSASLAVVEVCMVLAARNTQTQVILGYTTANEHSRDLSVMELAVKEHKFSSAGDAACPG